MKEQSNTNYFSGWNLTITLSLLLITNVLVTLAILDIQDKETISVLIRSTAKFSFTLFILTFSASSLYYFWKNSFTKWLLANRRYIGVSFAISHYLHLFSLILMTLFIKFNVFEDRGVFVTVAGGIAYLFITIMTITSFDKVKKLISLKHWKRIHITGSYLLWIIFAKSYLPNAFHSTKAIIFSVILLVVLGLRVLKLIKIKKNKI